MILAKPNGLTLEQHTQDVRDEGVALLNARPFVVSKYEHMTGKDLRASLDFCAFWHDEGKRHPKWQSACLADYELWKLDPNARGKNLMKSGIRHEMDSLVRLKKSGHKHTKSDLIAIAAHHGKLARRAEKRWADDPNFPAFWLDFVRWGGEFRLNDTKSYEAAILKRYLYDGPRALLQLADHRASARENGETLPALEKFDYQFPHRNKETGEPSLRGVQTIIPTLWNDKVAILRAPTGAGKTDAALMWAKHQIDEKRADRLIIAMPTRFTSNALAVNTAKALSQVGVYHSTAYFNRKTREQNDEGFDARWIEKEQELARLLETPVTVTTLDHLCIALTGAREDHHSIFWGLANSCVVIDEADFYDEFTQYNLVTLLRALRVLEVPVLIMSATVPPSALELYSQAGTPIAAIHEDRSDLERVRCRIHFERDMETPEEIADLLGEALKGKPTIIYANTVKRAQAYCDWFERKGWHAREDDEDDSDNAFVLYHSRFTEPDKARKEKYLIEMLGADAWDEKKPGKARGVAILTQIGELSVNISANLMISDLCPVDRLAQRAGRLARFEIGGQHVVGDLHVVTPFRTDTKNQREFYPAPYGEFSAGNGWTAGRSLLETREWLKNGDFSAQRWIDGVEEIYPTLQKPSQRTEINRDKLEKSLISHWMIVPQAEVGEDDDGTKDWKSRDIPLQKKVYVDTRKSNFIDGENEIFFDNWRRFREWETSTVISVMAYETKLGLDTGLLEHIPLIIGEEVVTKGEVVEKIFIAKSAAYSFARGLVLTPQQDEAEETWNPHDED